MILLGVEDGSFDAFNRNNHGYTLLCATTTYEDRITNIRLAKIEVDGFDATDRLVDIMEGIKVDVVILGGVTFAGFNMIDPKRIHREFDVPVIVYSGKRPDNSAIMDALRKHFPDWKRRWSIVKALGQIHEVNTFAGEPPVYFEAIGCEAGWAEIILRNSAIISRIPEPVRVSGLVAKGLTR
ncbi:MAG: DUF99 family protein, partial [Candidatus Bathyarchaeota archaeon]